MQRRTGAAFVVLMSFAAIGTNAAVAREVVKCGATLESTVISETSASVTSSVAFKTLLPATTRVRIPAGKTRCVKLRLAIETICSGEGAGPHFCVIRAMDNGQEIEPVDETGIAFADDSGGGGVRSFQWAKRVGPGLHTITIQRSVVDSASIFAIDSFVFDVEVTR